ncbi:DUF2303 family protein [Sphingobium yanoikuyae]|uniref:DUF2303 family protein n=1 Tax=Sphingobium yanoikuyae TaxID=13690 RepID=UPI0035C688F8
MTDETTQPDSPEVEAREDSPAGFAIPLSVLGNLLGGRAVHEGGVHGSVLAQTRDLVEAYAKPELVSIDIPGSEETAAAYVDHEGVHVIDPTTLDGYRTAPRFRRGVATLTDLPSFIGHVNRFKDDGSMVFASDDRSAPSLTAVLDYHPEGAESGPRFGKHRSSFHFPLSDEWKAWTAANGKKMTMADFAAFLEDRITEVVPAAAVAGSFKDDEDPMKVYVDSLGGTGKLADPTRLMVIASEMNVLESSQVSEAVRLQSGEGKINFQVDHTVTDGQGKSLTVPAAFGVGIPVFKGEQPYCVLARLRYRKEGGRLVFWYELWRTDLVFDDAFNGAVDKVQQETGLTVWKGQPEA